VFRVMPLVSGFFLKTRAPYLYLPRSIEAFYQPPEFCGVVSNNGFVRVTSASMTLGIATVYRARNRG
jgi:ubiquinone/menaquinone biosynthesis C-methylase UbiE